METSTQKEPKQFRPLNRSERTGVDFQAYFTADYLAAGDNPYNAVEWETRDAVIRDFTGSVKFEQKNVHVPKAWSQTATNIVASKYFHGKLGTTEREFSAGQLIHRVTDTIADWGLNGGYFENGRSYAAFRNDLAYILLNQMAAFNSPVWFNVGVQGDRGYGFYWDESAQVVKKLLPTDDHHPQCSACFINSVSDSMESILDLAKTEGMLFKWGSGSGTNFSTIREVNAGLWGGGKASGPLSFMKGLDAFAGVIKSGGKTRRAAKMCVLNTDHPDIEQFIWCKAKEEKKAHALIGAGYDASLDGEAYSSVFYQNANNSVRATNEFMEAVSLKNAANNHEYHLRSVSTGEIVKTVNARDLMRQIALATWECGDPGMQFDTTINEWHTSKVSGRINSSNPCSEYMFLDDSACNLASLNLMKFMTEDGLFGVEAFRHAVDTLILAQEILCEYASYPTEKIAQNSHDYRPLGLGYANLGALLMASGMAYDSDEGRAYAAAITAIMTGEAYAMSARIAAAVGPCAGYEANKESFLEVIEMHKTSVYNIDSPRISTDLFLAAKRAWTDALAEGLDHGYRNAQVSVLAPTGTIGFMMDCDTTGVEPELALVKHKKLVGGGTIKIVNQTVPAALENLGYSPDEVSKIVDYVDAQGTIEGAPGFRDQDLPVFDTSFRPANGKRSISYMGHIKMMAAVQPFISGAISKTVNMPEESTVEDIMNAYIESWELGVKAVAIYRDGSKKVQPLSSGSGSKAEKKLTVVVDGTAVAQQVKSVVDEALATIQERVVEKVVYKPIRKKLPDERAAVTHKFSVAGHEGYVTVGLYEDGKPGELFISMAKEGSTISGMMDTFATSISFGLQYGVPLEFLVKKFSHVRFEPSGWTANAQIRQADSIIDYIFRWLGIRFLKEEVPNEINVSPVAVLRPTEPEPQTSLVFESRPSDVPLCSECGGMMTRNGSCFKCENCGGTSGCS